jgi:hypothetical protein
MRAFAGATATSGYQGAGAAGGAKASADWKARCLKSCHTLQSMTNWSDAAVSRIHAELDVFLVSRWQGRVIPRRTSFNASRRSAGSAARYSVTVDAGMGATLP